MPDIVGVRFKRAGKVYYFDPAGIDLKVYDYVVVQTARGVEMGQVTIAPKQVLESEITAELKPIVRTATPEDIKRAQDFAAKEDSAMAECAKMIAKLNLPMNLVAAEYNLDGSRLTFYFTAEERVDFRELVRGLTGFFKTRIELRQIGPRDQAKQIGGLGRCGRELCCGSFLTEFTPVSIKMAKEQDLPLDPMKISGVCGRLQCCLAYENDQYREAKAKMPRRGQPVSTPSGPGCVIGANPLKETVLVELESKASAEFPLSQIKVLYPEPAVQERQEKKEKPVETAAARTDTAETAAGKKAADGNTPAGKAPVENAVAETPPPNSAEAAKPEDNKDAAPETKQSASDEQHPPMPERLSEGPQPEAPEQKVNPENLP